MFSGMKIKDYPDLLTSSQVSTILGISTKTMYKILRNGEIKYIKIGREYKIPKKSLLEYLNI